MIYKEQEKEIVVRKHHNKWDLLRYCSIRNFHFLPLIIQVVDFENPKKYRDTTQTVY